MHFYAALEVRMCVSTCVLNCNACGKGVDVIFTFLGLNLFLQTCPHVPHWRC